MHSLFQAAPDASQPIIYHVEHMSDGRSFVSRKVRAKQNSRIFFTAVCSFTLLGRDDINVMSHQIQMPETDLPEGPAKDELDMSEINEISFTEKMVNSIS